MEKNFKTFKDLEFEQHPLEPKEGVQAICFFPNGYGISVIRFKLMFGQYGSYTSNDEEFECMHIYGNEEKWGPISEPIGHLKKDRVTEEMIRIQRLVN